MPLFPQTNLRNESEEYLARRDELRQAEIDLMRHRERVAELRRNLPPGAPLQNYVFEDSPTSKIRLSELFTGPNRSVIAYHFMFGKKQTKPCPMCTMFIDGLNGVANHVNQNADLVIVAAAPQDELQAFARTRGWNNLRLLSTGSNTFKYDLRSEDEEGRQDSTVSVIGRDADGTLRHSYSAHSAMSAEIKERGLDLLCAVYNLLDLTPQGRGSWYASFDYQ